MLVRISLPLSFLLLVACGGGNDVSAFYDSASAGLDRTCECAVEAGAYANIAECRAMTLPGMDVTQDQIDCAQDAFDDLATESDEATLECGIAAGDRYAECLEGATCESLFMTPLPCEYNFEACGEFSAPLNAAFQACNGDDG